MQSAMKSIDNSIWKANVKLIHFHEMIEKCWIFSYDKLIHEKNQQIMLDTVTLN